MPHQFEGSSEGEVPRGERPAKVNTIANVREKRRRKGERERGRRKGENKKNI